MKGYIHSFETFGTVDNGGIRFVLFLQGCAMRCRFCHNPDTWVTRRGKEMSVEEVMQQIRKYKIYFQTSGGGVTVSGGEPLLQSEFLVALFQICGRERIHRTIDTSGYAQEEELLKVLQVTDRVLFSLKVINSQKHRDLTGIDNGLILKNLQTVVEQRVPLVIRYVLIPTINNQEEDFEDLAKLILGLNKDVPVDILPYHRLGVDKWAQLGMEYTLEDVPVPTAGEINEAKRILQEHGIKVKERG